MSLILAFRSLQLIAVALLFPVFLTAAEFNEYRVGVRAEVRWKDMKKPTSEEIAQAKAQHSIYVIGQVQLLESLQMDEPANAGRNGSLNAGRAGKPQKLVKPLNEIALANQLRKALASNGYHEAVAGGPKPEIVLIVYYGRGYLPNPYIIPRGELSPASAFNELGVDNSLYTIDQTRADYQEKAQRAKYEKLMLMVIAVPYAPPPPGKLPQTLWKTIMTAEDPDHLDLNAVMPDMLTAAGPYFGGRVDAPETEVWKPIPEGRVILGETKALEEVPAPAKK